MGAACEAAGDCGLAPDLTADFHAHTAFAGGRDSVGVVVMAAERAGLRQLVIGDQAGAATTWLPAYQSAIARAQRRTEVRLKVAIEVEVVRADGWLDLPRDLSGLEALSVSVSRVPLHSGPASAQEVRARLRAGELRPADVAEALVHATASGLERASRYAPTQLARPLCLLGQLGLDVDEVDGGLLDGLAGACRVTGTAVEVSEAWRAPTPLLAYRLASAGVHLVPASDAFDAGRLAQWEYLRGLRSALDRVGGVAE
ncbi:MAG TPA: hydrolase [Rugosimonospora sp.]|nr:hydrolase [Rugosimonospora sp.]